MANHVYKLQGIQKNDLLYWNCCSQTSRTGEIVIKDDQKVYATFSKTSPDASLQQLGTGSGAYQGGANLRVEIMIIDSGDPIDLVQTSGNITDRSGDLVGISFSLCYEDWSDKDYNDFYLNVMAWRKKG